PIQSRKELNIDGKRLMEEKDARGGKWLGEAIAMAEKAVILKAVKNESDSIVNWLRKNKYI
ncbi:HD domain-containing protein, partial [Alkalibacterium sp.]